jgi:hypothetical protein
MRFPHLKALYKEVIPELIHSFIKSFKMAGNSCTICSRVFSSSSNRHRHEKFFHGQVGSGRKVFNEDEESPRYNFGQPDVVPSYRSEDDAMSDEEAKSVKSTESEDSETDPEEKDYWLNVVSDALDNYDMQIPQAEDISKEPYLSDFVNAMKLVVEEQIQFVKHMEEEDELYQKINETIERYDSNNYDREEAVDAAWHDRRFLLSRVIEDNMPLIETKWKEEHEEDSDDNEDNN